MKPTSEDYNPSPIPAAPEGEADDDLERIVEAVERLFQTDAGRMKLERAHARGFAEAEEKAAAHITALQTRVAEVEGERDTALTDAHDTASALNDLLDRAEREGVRARTCELAWEKDCKTAEQRVKELEGALRVAGHDFDKMADAYIAAKENQAAGALQYASGYIRDLLSAQSQTRGREREGALEHAVPAPK